MNDYKVNVIKNKAKRLSKYAEAKEELDKVQAKINKNKPNKESKAAPSIIDQLADFGEGCAKASEQMNKNLFGEGK